MNRTDTLLINTVMATILALQVIRTGIVIAQGDWWRLVDIATIAALAGTVIFRNLLIGRISR